MYEKTNWLTFNQVISPVRKDNQNFGWQVIARNDGRTLVSSAPTDTQGVLNFYFRRGRNNLSFPSSWSKRTYCSNRKFFRI